MILRVSATTYATGIYLSNNWYNPRQTSPPKPWPLNEIEELAVLQKLFKLAYAVPPELLSSKSMAYQVPFWRFNT